MSVIAVACSHKVCFYPSPLPRPEVIARVPEWVGSSLGWEDYVQGLDKSQGFREDETGQGG